MKNSPPVRPYHSKPAGPESEGVWRGAKRFVVRALLRRFGSRAPRHAGGSLGTGPALESGAAAPHYKTLRAHPTPSSG
jgi:hypothetical protein